MTVLNGLRVIEMGAIGPVPFAGMLLSDMGAEVIRIDRLSPSGLGIPKDTRFNVTARGRKSIAIDMKSDAGRALLLKLVGKADALIEGFRPGVMERLGVGPDEGLAANPALVYGRMTGLGQTGPMTKEVGHDLNYLGLTGALAMLGERDAPPTVPLNLIADLGGGALYLVVGVLAALLNARATGKGQVVDAAMTDGVTSLLATYYGLMASGRWTEARESNFLDGGAPFYRTYRTADAGYVSVAAIEPKFYRELCAGLGLDPDDLPPQHASEHWPALRDRFAAIFQTRTRADWEAEMAGRDACFAPVLSLTEAGKHPHLRARCTVVETDGVPQPAPAPRFSRTPSRIQSGPHDEGADAEEILKGWGFDAYERSALRASGVLGHG